MFSIFFHSSSKYLPNWLVVWLKPFCWLKSQDPTKLSCTPDARIWLRKIWNFGVKRNPYAVDWMVRIVITYIHQTMTWLGLVLIFLFLSLKLSTQSINVWDQDYDWHGTKQIMQFRVLNVYGSLINSFKISIYLKVGHPKTTVNFTYANERKKKPTKVFPTLFSNIWRRKKACFLGRDQLQTKLVQSETRSFLLEKIWPSATASTITVFQNQVIVFGLKLIFLFRVIWHQISVQLVFAIEQHTSCITF